jgi:hypothetical protein
LLREPKNLATGTGIIRPTPTMCGPLSIAERQIEGSVEENNPIVNDKTGLGFPGRFFGIQTLINWSLAACVPE